MDQLKLLLWRKPNCETPRSAADIAKEMLCIIQTLQKHFPEFSTFYIPASRKERVKETALTQSAIEHLLHKSEPDAALAARVGYVLSLFSSMDELASCSLLICNGSANKKLPDTINIGFPLCWDWRDDERAAFLEHLFKDLIEAFRPFWGCLANLSAVQQERYVVDGMLTTLHWLNYIPEPMLSQIDSRNLPKVLALPDCSLINGTILKTSRYPTISVEERACKHLEMLNSLLLKAPRG